MDEGFDEVRKSITAGESGLFTAIYVATPGGLSHHLFY